jgi:hypothetical protein
MNRTKKISSNIQKQIWLFSIQAKVACRQLGYPRALRDHNNSFFGSVPDQFSYDDVKCVGREMNLNSCPHHNQDNCSPWEGAGVTCDTSTAHRGMSYHNKDKKLRIYQLKFLNLKRSRNPDHGTNRFIY